MHGAGAVDGPFQDDKAFNARGGCDPWVDRVHMYELCGSRNLSPDAERAVSRKADWLGRRAADQTTRDTTRDPTRNAVLSSDSDVEVGPI